MATSFNQRLFAVGALALACGAAVAGMAADAVPEDRYQWLEDVHGEKALAWTRQRNAVSEAKLQQSPRYAALHRGITEVLDSPQRIPAIVEQGGQVYNLWRDAEHQRGLWRRASSASYKAGKPQWQTVLDLDALAKAEGENWVWAGASCLQPAARRCLVSLSRGGGDAHVVREFDTAERRFVAGGFALPEAKGGLNWIDADTVSAYTDFGPGTMTASGYPRIVKLWKRGQPLADAKKVFEAAAEDMGVWTWSDQAPGGKTRHLIERRTSFFAGEQHLLDAAGKLVRLDKPDDATALPFGDGLLLELRSDWEVGGKRYAAGSLLAIGLDEFLAGGRKFATLFEPTATSSLQDTVRLRDGLLLVTMDNVRYKLVEWKRGEDGKGKGAWTRRELATDPYATLQVAAPAGQFGNGYLLTETGFLKPSAQYLAEAGSDKRKLLKQLPAFFDAATHEVEQLHARSADGTLVPYFIVKPKGATPPAGGWPTLLYGYGGFEISMKPSYSGILGRGWLAEGGVYVLANIRGGGEFGPRWHQSAQKANRQRSYDDFIAVAEDVQRRGITSPSRLGIMGGSLGGMLVSVAMVQRPELFGAVVSQVPLTDMRRYHKLLAGHSWIAEYGDPDIPEQWKYIGAYSPYHNAKAAPKYPAVLYTSSTRDDRVHPAHARKMVAKLEELGQPVLYWENLEGGHSGAANSRQQAQQWALTYTFLLDALKK